MSESVEQTYNRPWLAFKSLVFWVWMVVNTIVCGIPIIIVGLFSIPFAFKMIHYWLALNLHGLKLICGLGWEVDGEENIPDTPCMVMSNHQSTWETYFLTYHLRYSVYVAKRSLALIPIFGWGLHILKFILIDRASGRSAIKQMTDQAKLRLVEDGRWLIVFPEGTRRPPGAPAEFRIGGSVVATNLGVDVLPVAVNSGEFWPRMGFIKWPGTITVSFGPVIKTQGKTVNEVQEAMQSWIVGRMAEISIPERFPYKG
ncbi:MAG: 1-acyl-sn-glycerol-3-phosphate acyltransferase [Gammaproteobacteria bacterium]|nr:1-acyl-sn-glycerol-3-phosphate acyltransferase [Gammaproteobacteria bacterium]